VTVSMVRLNYSPIFIKYPVKRSILKSFSMLSLSSFTQISHEMWNLFDSHYFYNLPLMTVGDINRGA
jgi:hypothetical protein